MLEPRSLVVMLKAAAEPTRLRILVLLRAGELNVKDLTRILGQSQPRISRHLKLMAEAGLISRHRDGSWAYFQLVEDGPTGKFLAAMLAAVSLEDVTLARDASRAAALKREREHAAQTYFREHAREWDQIRALHVSESVVEAALSESVGPRRVGLLVDLGTGTGRMLELFRGRYERGLGLDLNHTMLAYAGSRLEAAGIENAGVRHGDIYDVALPDAAADVVVMHQVLHFMAEPQQAIREAARLLAPGGRLVIVDFAPHNLEFLRDTFAHERLGLPAQQVCDWLRSAGLDAISTRTLHPDAGASDDKLSVILWTADRPAEASRTPSAPARRTVEA